MGATQEEAVFLKLCGVVLPNANYLNVQARRAAARLVSGARRARR